MRCEARGPSLTMAYKATPVALRWTLALSVAIGLVLTVHWLHASPSVILRSPIHIDGASPVGWPECIRGAAARIEDMARLDESLSGWRAGGEQVRRRKLQDAKTPQSKPRPKRRPVPAPGIATVDTWQEHIEKRRQGSKTGSSSLVAVVTANVWNRTELLLQSLTANRDAFEVLVIDELSDDETPQRLHQYGVRIVTPPERLGVTYNWNIAYRMWLQSDHEYLFYANNDVLVPDGAIDAMAQAMSSKGGDCDLITPQSTVRGKGYWGPVEGLELMLNLSKTGSSFVNSPLNFRRVQEALQQGGCVGKLAVKEESWLHNERPGFSGFFFGVRRSIQKWAYDEHNLFNTTDFFRNFGQEQDLLDRSTDPALSHRAKLCMHTGAFVFHYKGSTLPADAGSRAAWHLAPRTAPASGDVEQQTNT